MDSSLCNNYLRFYDIDIEQVLNKGVQLFTTMHKYIQLCTCTWLYYSIYMLNNKQYASVQVLKIFGSNTYIIVVVVLLAVHICTIVYNLIQPYNLVQPCAAMFNIVLPWKAMYTHVKPCRTVYNLERRNCTNLKKQVKWLCTTMCNIVQQRTNVYHHHTTFFRVVQPWKKVYNLVQQCTTLNNHKKPWTVIDYLLQPCTSMYKCVQPCTTVYNVVSHINLV